jgi:hypothetical protein
MKVVELCVDNSFVNWLKDWFSLVFELHGGEVGFSYTVYSLHLAKIAKS